MSSSRWLLRQLVDLRLELADRDLAHHSDLRAAIAMERCRSSLRAPRRAGRLADGRADPAAREPRSRFPRGELGGGVGVVDLGDEALQLVATAGRTPPATPPGSPAARPPPGRARSHADGPEAAQCASEGRNGVLSASPTIMSASVADKRFRQLPALATLCTGSSYGLADELSLAASARRSRRRSRLTVRLRSPAAISICVAADLADRGRRRAPPSAARSPLSEEAAGALAEQGLLGRAAALAQRLRGRPGSRGRRRSRTRPGRRRGRRR